MKLYFILTSLITALTLSGCEGQPKSTDNGRMSASVDARTIAPRKAVDELSPKELATYRHAIKRMKIKSEKNLYDRTGFLWQAWVHNCTNISVPENRQISVPDASKVTSCNLSSFLPAGITPHKEHPGLCVHGKDAFFQWHRAEFYFFEKALQDADPEGEFGPSTKDLRIPYWNFTKKPTGVRYPKAFEIEFLEGSNKKLNPLYHKNRNTAKIESPYSYTSPYLLADLIYNDDWKTFGGYPSGVSGNYGSFEGQIHNDMHDKYIGGDIKSPSTAGLDPMFFSFHAYIDYIFEKWIEEHGTESITAQKTFARGEQDASLLPPDGFSEGNTNLPERGQHKTMGQNRLYYDTKKLGYVYQEEKGGSFIPKSAIIALSEKHEEAGSTFGDSTVSFHSELLSHGWRSRSAEAKVIFQSDFQIPTSSEDYNVAQVAISRLPVSVDYSFQADFYLHPKKVDAAIDQKVFRDRYLLMSSAYWKLQGHHDHGEHPMPLGMKQDVTSGVNSLLLGGKGSETWTLTMAISSEADQAMKFELPEIILRK